MNKKLGLTIVSVIAAVSIVGAVSAQDTTTPPPADQTQQGALPLRPNGGVPVLRDLLQIVATDLNLEPQAVIEQMRGQTLAAVITAQNGDVAKVTADVVAAVTERINQAVADGRLTQERADEILGNLSDTVTQALNGELRGQRLDRLGGQRPGLGGQRPNSGVRPNMLNRDVRPLLGAVQDALGLTGQQIAEELRGGSTLGEVIAAHNGDSAAIIDAAIASATERLDAVRAEGTLTQEQENAMISGLKAFYEAILNGAFRPQAAPDAAQGSV